MSPTAATVHDPFAMRRAGRELLSLAFIDSRNRTLRWLSVFAGVDVSAARAEFDPPLWLVGHVAWFQERAIARNVQRARGGKGQRTTTLASIEPRADAWFDPSVSSREQRWRDTDVSDAHLRDYLAATLDTTLELLDKAEETDEGLHLYRLALVCEDRVVEMLAALAHAAGVGGAALKELWPIWPSRVRREPLWFGAQRWPLGSAPGGFVPDNERWAHEESVPEFEIDAQPVQWSQFAEFVEDGGYDERDWWSDAGWGWLERHQRRSPRYVEQLGRAVLAQRGGDVQRVPANQAVAHVSWYEADAWCRWAKRRLPTEVEWEIAASGGGSRGFVWGDVHEWVAGRARRWSDDAPVAAPPSVCDVPLAMWPSQRVTRGASVLTVPRLKHVKARCFASPEHDAAFVGFRSCAI
ncbi:MAG TPA: SUMF1/EgtB/PvdO family nonheme iron enzyme [Burkholderiaceae bacterium]|nr:SUMF1/EgtB/PvdO family nonheme iron enzyme [Burkholderiaceae bacterium]